MARTREITFKYNTLGLNGDGIEIADAESINGDSSIVDCEPMNIAYCSAPILQLKSSANVDVKVLAQYEDGGDWFIVQNGYITNISLLNEWINVNLAEVGNARSLKINTSGASTISARIIGVIDKTHNR